MNSLLQGSVNEHEDEVNAMGNDIGLLSKIYLQAKEEGVSEIETLLIHLTDDIALSNRYPAPPKSFDGKY